MSMVISRVLITLFAVTMFLGGCVSMPLKEAALKTRFIDSPKVHKVLTEGPAKEEAERNKLIAFFADPDERKMKRGITGRAGYLSVFESEVKVVSLPALQRYIDGIIEALLAQWPGQQPEPKIQVKLIASEMPDAYATEFNEIYVSLGLIKDSETEDEVAGLLGHELAHILLRHFNRQNRFRSQRHVLSAIKNLAVTTNQVRNSRIDVEKGNIKVNMKKPNKVKAKAIEATAMSMLIDEVSSSVIYSLWSRKQESEADLLGVDLATAAGYSPGGLETTLNTIILKEANQKSRLDTLKEIHAKKIRQLSQEGGPSAVVGYSVKIVKDNVGGLGKDALDWIRRKHMNPEKRAEMISSYYEKWYEPEYEKREDRPKMQARLHAAIQKSQLDAAMKSIQHSRNALEALAKGDIRTAEHEGYSSLRGPLANSSQIRMTMYLIRDRQGSRQRANALGNLRRIADLQIAPLSVFDIATREHLADGQIGRAERFIRKGEQRFGPNPMYPLRIALSARRGEVEKAKEYFTACKAVNNKQLTELCTNEMSLNSAVLGKEYERTGLLDSFRTSIQTLSSNIKENIGKKK